MADTPETSLARYYDAVPYSSFAYPDSAPGHLAAVAHLFGLDAPDVSSARVLELGCASGGNLLPFALGHPAAEAVGIDISGGQIARGREQADRLGLSNVQLLQADFASIDAASLGRFDYIICHGVYSWIPRAAQDALLRLCSEVLAPDGVAYVSYKTYPGWKSREIIRDAMLLHCRDRTDPRERVAYAKAMVGFLRKMVPKGSLLSGVVEENARVIARTGDDYLSHDYLEPSSNPCYFEEFVAAAGRSGLAYMAEARVGMMYPENYGPDVATPLRGTFGSDQVKMEQYLDFVLDRSFRQSLLVHADRAGDMDHRIKRGAFADLHVAACIPCRSGATRDDASMQDYGRPDARIFSTNNPMMKHMADALTRQWPGTLTRRELLDAAAMHPASFNAAESDQVVDSLIEHLVVSGSGRVRKHPVRCSRPDDRPRLAPHALAMVRAGEDSGGSLANAWHEAVDLTADERRACSLMDGTRSRDALAADALAGTAGGEAARREAIERIIRKAEEQALFCEGAVE